MSVCVCIRNHHQRLYALRGLCKFVEEKLPVNHATNLTWDDVIRAQVSLGMLPVSSHPDHQYQQPQSMTGKAETYQYQVMPGGRSIPAWCIPRHRVAVIVSFRARDQHLTSFIGHLHPFLRSQLLDFIIIVVQQVGLCLCLILMSFQHLLSRSHVKNAIT